MLKKTKNHAWLQKLSLQFGFWNGTLNSDHQNQLVLDVQTKMYAQSKVKGESVEAEPKAKKAVKRSSVELEEGEIKKQRIHEKNLQWAKDLEEEEDPEEEEDFEGGEDLEGEGDLDSEDDLEGEEDFDSEEDLYDDEDFEDEEDDEDLEGEGPPKVEAEPELEDFGGEQIPECCQEQIRLLLEDNLNGDKGKKLKNCCTEIWSGFRRFGFRWYKFRLFKQVYAPNGVKEKCCETLGIPESASQDEIKRAYLKLARQFHPDKNPNRTEEDDTKFKKILKAYETLVGKR